MQNLFDFIKEKYKSEFINKILEYPVQDTQVSDFLFDIDYSWKFYWLDSNKSKIKLRNPNNIKQYFLWSLNEQKDLSNSNLIIANKEFLNENIKAKLLSLLSFWWYLIIVNQKLSNFEVIQRDEVSESFINLFLQEFADVKNNSFDKAISSSLKKGKFNFKKIPTKFNILKAYKELINKWKLERNIVLEQELTRKKTRSMSWITAITVLTKPYPCPWECIFCPKDAKMPKSYVKEEAACQRALRLEFSAYDQVKDRISALENAGHNTEKIELIILWGTFPAYTRKYQEKFVKNIFKALNSLSKDSKLSMKRLQELNENAKCKMVWLSVEIRPDFSDDKTLIFLRYLWVTRIEIWVQSLDNKVLELNKRWHSKKDIINATKNLKKYWFKILYHMMLWLPWSTTEIDKKMFKQLFSSKNFKPDQLKIYPCLIIKWSELENIYKSISFKPLSTIEIIKLITFIKKYYIPKFTRIARVTRDIPSNLIIEWSKSSNIRENINQELIANKISCKCIRCREIKDEKYNLYKIKTKRLKLNEAHEYYIEATTENNSILWLCRLYMRNATDWSFLNTTSLIRELHVFWKSASIINKDKKVQHKWIWEILLRKAENISKKQWKNKISVISAIGTRWYYRKFWYVLEDSYMSREF